NDFLSDVKAPRILEPVEGIKVSAVGLVIKASPYGILYNANYLGVTRQFQVQLAGGDWTSLLVDYTGTAESYALPINLLASTAYEVRVRDIRSDGSMSRWSRTVLFETQRVIQTPVNVSPADNQLDMASPVTLVSSVFSSLEASETHLNTEYRLFDEAGNVVLSSGLLGSVRFYTLPTYLFDNNGTVFQWQV